MQQKNKPQQKVLQKRPGKTPQKKQRQQQQQKTTKQDLDKDNHKKDNQP